jgi:3-dehydroquinate dehydratase type I
MKKPVICGVIVDGDMAAVREAEPLVDMFEVRIDLIGSGWQDAARQLGKPWIACNRMVKEDGGWQGSEARRKEELLKACELGASIVDIELGITNLERLVPIIKKKAKCLISFHNMEKTPPLDNLEMMVKRQLAAGADICKVVTTAREFRDNLTMLELLAAFPEANITAFTMGDLGLVSRVICPLLGGGIAYAAIKKGGESAPGQITVAELYKLYEMANK